jgi:hypothetical protein
MEIWFMLTQSKKFTTSVGLGITAVGLSFIIFTGYSSARPQKNVTQEQITENEIIYPNGVTVSRDSGKGLSSPNADPRSASRATVIPCDAGFVCLYENDKFGGRRLQWSASGTIISNLDQYGFNNRMTSWNNRSTKDAKWFFDINQRGTAICMNAQTRNSNVGPTYNDKASSLRIYSSSRACN